MSEFNKNHNNLFINFMLKGVTSILIGIYFLIAAYGINFILDGFLIDGNVMGMMSAEIIEILIITMVCFVFLFSSLAFFFKGKRTAKKNHHQLWNEKTKVVFWKYFIGNLLLFCLLLFLLNKGYVNYITPSFLIFYGILVFILKNKKRKDVLILSLISILLGVLCLLIPMYWYSALCILGIAHISFGIVVRK
ncbi:MAG: hypothetical protein ACPGTO_05345 [Polaribacter sp.]